MPELEIEYSPDSRQNIADSWPMVRIVRTLMMMTTIVMTFQVFDDSLSRQEWGWNHDIDLARLVEIMITNLKTVYADK